MIFLTVGTQFPFDRLVKSVDEMISENGFKDEIFAQIGESSYQPRNFEAVSFLEKRLFDKHIREASGIISHGGIGTIAMALEYNKPLLAMPRLKRYGEVVHDHQVAIVKRFELLGHILVAYEVAELPAKIKQLKNFMPCRRAAQPQAVAGRIAQFLNELSKKGRIL
jgi:UDP-N-acetylglucosamine transferase subunit ALG13